MIFSIVPQMGAGDNEELTVNREVDDNNITATFETPQRAATPGQSIVFYVEEKVIGGGFIE